VISETERMARSEREFTIKLLHHLNEIRRRKLHLDLGYSSLYDYCVRKLKYSGPAAGRRIAAARCIRCFPDVLRSLEDRELSLSTVALIEPILNEDNAATILERVRNASHRDVERVVSEYKPPVALRDRIRPVRVAAPEPKEIDRLLFERECARIAPFGWEHRATVEQKMLVQFLASEELVQKFEQAKTLLSSRGSEVTFADVLEVLVTEFLTRRDPALRHKKREDKKRVIGPDSRRREWNDEEPRSVSAAVRDEVYVRDGGQCTFMASDGTRCESRKGLEIDHVLPVAAGGTSKTSNLRLLCAAHNLRAAELTLGAPVMAAYWARE
jgi:5-methylcytosine-specific restriction endonuclease McrA